MQTRRQRRRACTILAIPAASDEGFEACHEVLLANLELLREVLEYVGEGHHCFVAGVCTQWRGKYCTDLYPAAETVFSSVVSSVECVNWATSQHQGLKLCDKLFLAAARYGDVEVCQALYGKYEYPDCPWKSEDVCEATAFNTAHGLKVLQWLRSEDGKELCPWLENGSEMCAQAASEGRLDMLKWLLSDDGGADFDSISWNDACHGGHIPVVEWLLEHPPTRALLEENDGDDWCYGAWYAAGWGGPEVLQFLHANARHLCKWDSEICRNAVLRGKSAVLKWLRSEEVQCEWDEESCPQVIRDRQYGGSLLWDIDAKTFEEIKQWVHANGHPCNCQD